MDRPFCGAWGRGAGCGRFWYRVRGRTDEGTRNTEHQHSSSVPPACSSRPAGGPTGSRRHRRCMGMAARFRLCTQHAQYRHESTARLSTPRPGSFQSTPPLVLLVLLPRLCRFVHLASRRWAPQNDETDRILWSDSERNSCLRRHPWSGREYLAVFNNWEKPSLSTSRADAVRLPGSLRILFTVRWPLRIATSQRPHHTSTPASRFPLPSHVHVKTQAGDRERDTARISNPPWKTPPPFPAPPPPPPKNHRVKPPNSH
jgi:hypothetical protein